MILLLYMYVPNVVLTVLMLYLLYLYCTLTVLTVLEDSVLYLCCTYCTYRLIDLINDTNDFEVLIKELKS